MNKLANEKSPYLLQHAANPVDWYPWGEQALSKAITENKLIIVSVGYSTCHWCHVMAHESFEDPDIAKVMNQYFVNIKIDREERPDLDHYFMEIVQLMGNSGGWPLHVFLSAQLDCIYGGTYFPPEPKYGRPSWLQILHGVHKAFSEKNEQIVQQAYALKSQMVELNTRPAKIEKVESLSVETVFLDFRKYVDPIHGGFGTAPKFPQCSAIHNVYIQYFLSGNKEGLLHALFSLKKMTLGGIYDHVGGGYCRYAVDGAWAVPHFEKMLYDHAQIVRQLAIAYSYTKDPFFKIFILESLSFFDNEMRSPEGFYYAAMDADSEGEEGKFYVWREAELKEIFKDKFPAFCKFFSWTALDHAHPDDKVLQLKVEFLDQDFFAKNILQKQEFSQALKTIRATRTEPSKDKKEILAWNSLMVSTLVAVAKAFGSKEHADQALHMCLHVHKMFSLAEDKTAKCRYRIDGKMVGEAFLEDYSYLIQAGLDTLEICNSDILFQSTIDLITYVLNHFSVEDQVLFSTAEIKEGQKIPPMFSWSESSTPNANAIMANNLRRLALILDNEVYMKKSEEMIQWVKPHFTKFPFSAASWVSADMLFNHYQLSLEEPVDEYNSLSFFDTGWLPELSKKKTRSATHSFQLCYNGQCHIPVSSEKEILSLFQNEFLFTTFDSF